MISIVSALLIGWLLHFVHLNNLFNYFLGFDSFQYYLMFFILGFANAIKNMFIRGNK